MTSRTASISSRRLATSWLLCLLLAATGCAGVEVASVRLMPSFSLSTVDGQIWTLDDMLGEVTLVDFFFPT